MAFYKSCRTCSEIFRPTYDGQAFCPTHDRETELARAAPVRATVKPGASSIRTQQADRDSTNGDA